MSTTTGKKLDSLTPLHKAALAIKELRSKIHRLEEAKKEPIAIVGMAGRFPGADNMDEYWELLANGRDTVCEVPPERWDVNRFFDPNPNAPGKISNRCGGFLDKVDEFDAAFFGISPLEAEHMDPQHRLLLEVAWHALEDSGQPPQELRGSKTGVFVGITQNDYGMMQMAGSLESIQAYSGIGSGACFTAGRLSFTLGLNGPAFAVDTACSSSMTALHQACQSLRNAECDLAIIAGVQLNLTPPMQVFLSKTQSFSPQGRCFTFDERANGFVIGEGVAVAILRRKQDALTRGDSIRAIIRASAINHDGPGSGLTVPNEAAQEALLHEAQTKADITPADIDYVEAHGTATVLGDPIEVGSLRALFGEQPRKQPLFMGAVKANFGHLNAASGISGLMKVVLMLENETIVPQPNFKTPNPRIPWEDFSVKVPTQLTEWPRGERPRLAGVNSFSMSGTNVHVILEESPARPVSSTLEALLERPLHLLALSARNDAALKELARSFKATLSANGKQSDLPDICFSANTGRNHFEHRLAISATSMDELEMRLDAFLNTKPPDTNSSGTNASDANSPDTNSPDSHSNDISGIWNNLVPKGGLGRSACFFTDDIPVALVRVLGKTQPKVSEILDQCQSLSHTYLNHDLFVQPECPAARFACQYALTQLWRSWGLKPAVVSGIGVGELSAACCATVFNLEQAFQVLAGKTVNGKLPVIQIITASTGEPVSTNTWTDYQLPLNNVDPDAENVDTSKAKALHSISSGGYKVLLAMGTTRSLKNVVKDVVKGVDVLPHHSESTKMDAYAGWLPMLSEKTNDPWQWILELLASLYINGLKVDWNGFDSGYVRHRLRIPHYPFQRRSFWIDQPEPELSTVGITVPPAAPSSTLCWY